MASLKKIYSIFFGVSGSSSLSGTPSAIIFFSLSNDSADHSQEEVSHGFSGSLHASFGLVSGLTTRVSFQFASRASARQVNTSVNDAPSRSARSSEAPW